MKTGKIRKPLRRLSILALVLVLVLNSGIIARAENVVGMVYSYQELSEAIAGAQSGDVIELGSSIRLPQSCTLGEEGKYVTLRRKAKSAGIITTNGSGVTTLRAIIFDGNEGGVNGTAPILTIEGTTDIIECDFIDCVNGNNVGGAIRIKGDVPVTIRACTFTNGNAVAGAHIYNESSKLISIVDSFFSNGWADNMGGSIYCARDASSLSLSNVVIKGNSATQGGGIYTNGSLSIEDSIVYQNEAVTQGADIIALGDYTNTTTEDQYNYFLSGTGLYFSEWADDTNPSVGCSGVALKFITTDTPPTTEDPTEPSEGGEDEPSGGEETEPSSEGGETGGDTPTEPSGEDITDPTEGGSESGENPSEPASEDDPDDNPTEGGEGSENPSEGGESGSDEGGENPTDPQENPTEPSGGEDDTNPTDPSEESSEGGSIEDSHDTTDSHDVTDSNNTTDSHDTTTTDNHTEDSHDTDDHSTTDNSSHDTSTVTDSHDDNSGSGNTSNVSNIDNSSEDRSTTDNSSHRSTHTEDNSYRDNSNTYNYYYDPKSGAQGVQIVEIPQYVPVESSGGSQPVSVNVPVDIKIPESSSRSTEDQEPYKVVQAPAQNIRIEAEGVNVLYEYTADGVSISIKATEAEQKPADPQASPTPPAQADKSGANWVDYVCMCLLAVLVLGELKDLFRKKVSKTE